MQIMPLGEITPLEEDLINNVRLYRITEMVYQKDESVMDKFTTVFNTLSTYNASVFFLIDSDGKQANYYLGVRNNEANDSPRKRSTVTLGDTLRQTLIGHFPGVKIENEDRVRFVKKDDKDALMMKTIVKPIRTTNDFSLVEVKIITGRMHQIRIHLSSIDHPVIGDRKYGDFALNKQMKQQFGLNNQLLHAYKINFVDPFGSLSYLKGKKIICPKPTQFKKIEKSLFESVL